MEERPPESDPGSGKRPQANGRLVVALVVLYAAALVHSFGTRWLMGRIALGQYKGSPPELINVLVEFSVRLSMFVGDSMPVILAAVIVGGFGVIRLVRKEAAIRLTAHALLAAAAFLATLLAATAAWVLLWF